MKAKTVVLTLAICLMSLPLCFASDAMICTWKLNEAKSKIPAGSPKNTSVVVSALGGNMKISIDGVDSSGKPTHSEWTGKFDGKDYAVTGDATSDMRSYTKVDDHSTDFAAKKGGKTTISGRVTISADGKTRTVNLKANDSMGMSVEATYVYDKQ